jgi:hypothetical protein
VVLPAPRRTQPQSRPISDLPTPCRNAAALSGAALNERLVILLPICASGAASLVSAAHFPHG